MTRTVAIVQARMTSTRLPGKVLAELDGEPMLAHMLSRVRRSRRLDAVWVATTRNPTDDPVITLCDSLGVATFRGDEQDVLGRFAGAAAAAKADVIMRLTADCPMSDPALIDEAVERRAAGGFDYLSNAIHRTYPDGLDIEIFTRAAVDEADRAAHEPFYREHVTPYMRVGAYSDVSTGDFRVGHLIAPADFGFLRWTVDTADDLARVRRLVAALPAEYGWLDVIALLTRRPDLASDRPEQRPDIRLRPAGREDVDLLFDWVNRPEKLATALRTTAPIPRDEHEAWFVARLADPDAGIWIALDATGAPVGQARLERRDNALEVDLFVVPAWRELGAASVILDAARGEAARRWPGLPLVARIRPDNWPSRRAFVKAGYGDALMARSHLVLRRAPLRPRAA